MKGRLIKENHVNLPDDPQEMLKSMTGFGSAQYEFPEKKINIEIKTFNSKQLDVFCKLPPEYNSKEPEIRSLVGQKVVRGKVYLTITKENANAGFRSVINHKQAEAYYDQLKALSANLGVISNTDYLSLLLKMPDVLSVAEEMIDEEEWLRVASAITTAINQLDNYRIAEGEQICADLETRIDGILEYLLLIEPFEKERIQILRDRILRDLLNAVDESKIDKNRFEQEMIYYIEKIDISEEKHRLNQNCKYFNDTLACEDSEGRKLLFICQEIGREINTLGSKSYHSEMQKLVVNMKDELEKIKEQLMNVV